MSENNEHAEQRHEQEPQLQEFLKLLDARFKLAEHLDSTDRRSTFEGDIDEIASNVYVENDHDSLTRMSTAHIILRTPLHVSTRPNWVQSSVDDSVPLARMLVHAFRLQTFDEGELDDDGSMTNPRFRKSDNFVLYLETPDNDSEDTCYFVSEEGIKPFHSDTSTNVAEMLANAFEQFLQPLGDFDAELEALLTPQPAEQKIGSLACAQQTEAPVKASEEIPSAHDLLRDIKQMYPMRFQPTQS